MRHNVLQSTSLLLAFVAACQQPPAKAPTPEVTVAPALARDVADFDEFTGHLDAIEAVEIRPRVSGFIQNVAFHEGAIVERGTPLVTIDQRPYEAEVARAEAVLEQARVHEQLAQQELERAKRLVNTQAISREELDARTSAVADGAAAARAADAALRMAKLNLEWTVVRAPIAGRVGRAEITAGNLVQAGPPSPSLLTTIVSLDPLYVYFDADERAYLKYAGAAAALRGGNSRSIQVGLSDETGFPRDAKIDFVDNRVDRTAGTIRVRAVLSNANHQLTPGMFARVRLAADQRRAATMVQDQAIGTDQDRKFVLVLKPDSTIEYRPVVVGRVVDGLRVVSTGLQPGESVVINGLLRVRPGMKVAAKTGTMLAVAPSSHRPAGQ